jgi:two-component system chemotaxis response regulator CheB
MRDLAHLRLPIAVVQHMPPGYTAKFAARLAAATGLDVLGSTDDQLTARLALTIHHIRCNTPVQKESV